MHTNMHAHFDVFNIVINLRSVDESSEGKIETRSNFQRENCEIVRTVKYTTFRPRALNVQAAIFMYVYTIHMNHELTKVFFL